MEGAEAVVRETAKEEQEGRAKTADTGSTLASRTWLGLPKQGCLGSPETKSYSLSLLLFPSIHLALAQPLLLDRLCFVHRGLRSRGFHRVSR